MLCLKRALKLFMFVVPAPYILLAYVAFSPSEAVLRHASGRVGTAGL